MKITSIKQQIKNQDRVSIFVDEEYSFSLNLGELISEKLKKGQKISDSQLKQLKKISEDGKLKLKTLNWLLLRPHSEKEFKAYLKRNKAEGELIDQWLIEFRDRKYLDDVAFAKWFSDNRARKNKSNRAIMSELFQKGISREVASEIMKQGSGEEEDRLKLLIIKKQKSSRYQSDPLKLAKYLTAQGFNYYLVKKHLAKHQPED